VKEEENTIKDVTLYDLIASLERLVNRLKEKEPMAKVSRDEISIKDRMKEIRMLLSFGGGMIRFTQLFSQAVNRTEIVTTFLALLELMKTKQITCVQNQLFQDIMICDNSSKGGEPHGL
jgi:segregation and condensation protein A